MKKFINVSLVLITNLCLLLSACNAPKSEESTKEISKVVDQSTVDRIDSTLKSFVDAGQLAGVSALVYEKGEEVYFNTFGYSDREAGTPMSRNTIVLIYSMTKPLTGTALMTLYEDGAFQLDDPVSKYLPEFSDMQVYSGVDSSGNIMVEPLDRPITVRDLTRHTTGIINRTDVPGLGEKYGKLDIYNREGNLTEMAEKLSSIPLWFQPGTQWEYGTSVDMQALIVERISGKPFHEYLKENVLDPLGMKETRYFVPEMDRDRLAANYRLGNDTLNRIPDEQALSFNTKQWPLKLGGWGLTSTLDDYMQFAQMLVNEGQHGETKILEPETVKLMATDHLTDSVKIRSFLENKGQVGFGIDFAVRLSPPASPEENNGEVGEFFWDGAASTLFWVDPKNELTAVLFVQLFPYDQIGLHKNFRDAVYGHYPFPN
ncbi:serine hydrolase domain-containing protein [Flexithrix dorotheae]|uniref:serine hydrolase domain-containing protein n=1 Tax=Flexithrix dorotheae TaxID=70993 RepID=UPI00036A3555|nr:serine hydrolase domain-containing protein [Flexithrix dorotheae]